MSTHSFLKHSFLFLVVASCTAACAHSTQRCSTSITAANTPNHDLGRIRKDTLGKVEGSYPEHITLRVDDNGYIEKIAAHRKDYGHVPENVRNEVNARFPNSLFVEYELNLYPNDPERVYAVQVKNTLKETCQISVKESGEHRHTSCHVEVAQLPSIVRAVIAKIVPTGKIVSSVARKSDNHAKTYNVKVLDNNLLYRVLIRENGQIVEQKVRIPAWVELSL